MADLSHALHLLRQYEAGSNTVCIWIAHLDRVLDERFAIELLDEQELQRAAAFRFAIHRKRFVAGRACLRILLASSLACEPKDVHFTYGPWGKPALEGTALSFNAAHSEDLAVYAVGGRAQIGVDVELCRQVTDADALADRYFSHAERRALASIPNATRGEAFLRYWTRKEAYVKALGEGLYHPLGAFDVSVEPPYWRLFDLDLQCAAVGALAVCLAS